MLRAAIGAAIVLVLLAPSLSAPATSNYLRVVSDSKGKPRLLQTAIGHFVLANGQRVDLVGAVHLAEKGYYRALNERFRGYDAVLYELILNTDGKQPTGPIKIPRDSDGGGSSLSQVQLAMCRMLGLQFQLHSVDYAAANFRHADLTLAEFQAAMQRQGESSTDLLLKILKVAMENSGGADDPELQQLDLLALLMREPTPKEQKILRRVFARSFPQIEQMTSEIQGTTLIAGRNRRALEVLSREINGGRRNVAIFYGAGHMGDMERRLLGLPGARLVSREWLDAWSLQDN